MTTLKLIFTAAVITVISVFQNCSRFEANDTSGQISLGSHDLPTSQAKIASLAQPRLGSRHYIRSVLTRIYAANHDPLLTSGDSIRDLINSLVTNNISAFGGACNFYDVRGRAECDDLIENAKEDYFAKSNVARAGYMEQACEALNANPGAFANALALVKANPVSAPPTLDEISQISELFYSSSSLDSESLEALNEVSQAAFTSSQQPLESWRYVFLTVCLSPTWQNL